MSERRTPRDARRRSHGQNFLVDRDVVRRLLTSAELQPNQLVLEIGAGRGALTLPLAKAGARVIAVEKDKVWAKRLQSTLERVGLEDRVQVVADDFRRVALPTEEHRVIASPPYGLTTALLGYLLDDPTRGPWRADLILQREVATKRARIPPANLRSAAWAPWWTFKLGMEIDRRSFRPVPGADSALLTIRRRPEPVLPEWLAPNMREALRPVWDPLKGR